MDDVLNAELALGKRGSGFGTEQASTCWNSILYCCWGSIGSAPDLHRYASLRGSWGNLWKWHAEEGFAGASGLLQLDLVEERAKCLMKIMAQIDDSCLSRDIARSQQVGFNPFSINSLKAGLDSAGAQS
jgi:hypothetical protein